MQVHLLQFSLAFYSFFLKLESKPLNRFITKMTIPTKPISVQSSSAFLAAMNNRRSYYVLNKSSPISNEDITSIVQETLLSIPSAFNSQSSRVVVLFGNQHEAFWDIALEAVKEKVTGDRLAYTVGKQGLFKASYGTVSHF
jgi:predicted oxidoreductase (fatty acid repression mutant protein)